MSHGVGFGFTNLLIWPHNWPKNLQSLDWLMNFFITPKTILYVMKSNRKIFRVIITIINARLFIPEGIW